MNGFTTAKALKRVGDENDDHWNGDTAARRPSHDPDVQLGHTGAPVPASVALDTQIAIGRPTDRGDTASGTTSTLNDALEE